jgi:hypothetical protein
MVFDMDALNGPPLFKEEDGSDSDDDDSLDEIEKVEKAE